MIDADKLAGLLARLRSKECCDNVCMCDEAADCIDAQAAEVLRLRADPALGAAAMREAAAVDLISFANAEFVEGPFVRNAASSIRALPLPSHADMLAAALRLPEIAALVEAATALLDLNDTYAPFGGEMYQDRVDRTWGNARTALAALKGVGHE